MVKQAERSAHTIELILAVARTQFSRSCYDAVSIDVIADEAGVAKGAIYHHFSSKRQILELLVDHVQAELAAHITGQRPVPEPTPTPAMLAAVIGEYLRAAMREDRRQILLIDGPTVLGWQLWRQIDDRHFATMLRGGIAGIMGSEAATTRVDAVTRLVMGAIMEAALACGKAQNAEEVARQFEAALQQLLSGLQSMPAP